MVTGTLQSKVALDWYAEKESVTRQGLSVPYLVIGSDDTSFSGVPLLPTAEEPFHCSFYLKNTYRPGQIISRELIQRGDLEMNVTLNLPDQAGIESVFFHKACISLVNEATEKILKKTKLKAGRSPSFQITALLDEDSCDQYYRMIRGLPSALHLLIEMTFYVEGIKSLKSLESLQPLSKVFQRGGISKDLFFRYLDVNHYDPLTRGFVKVTTFQTDPEKRKKDAATRQPIFAVKNNKVSANHAALQPVSHLTAVHLINSPSIVASATALNRIENLTLIAVAEKLPLVEDENRKWFKDQTDKNLYWAIPQFELVKPKPNDDPLLSPFRFLFRTLGMDKEGKPVLEGEITFSLRVSLAEQVKNEIQQQDGNAKINLIDTRNIAVSLEIPFLNENSQLTTSTLVTEEFRWNQDTLITTFRMSNEWIRLSYGILSAQNAAEETRLKIHFAYTFEGMGIKPPAINVQLLSQNIFKIAALPLMTKKTRGKPATQRYFDVETRTLVDENGRHIAYEDHQKPRAKSIAPVVGRFSALSTLKITQPAISKLTLLPLAYSSKIDKFAAENKYTKRSFLRKEKIALEFDCTKYGAFYEEEDGQGEIASVGCKEPYKLGEVRFSLYVPLSEIQDDDFKVYQSTQIPNRFLVVPRRYVITRFEPQRADVAFEPCLRLYSTIDAEDLERSRCILDASLAPDIDRFKLEDLHFQLSQFTAYTPYISFPGEIEHSEIYNWAIPASLIEDIDSFSLGAFIRMVLSAKIEGVLTINSLLNSTGLSGKVTFTLPDGSIYASDLMISLESVKGPFINGALIAEKKNASLFFKNGLRQRVQLTEIHAYKNYEDKITIPVEKTLEGGEGLSIDIEHERIHVAQYVAESTSETLSEIRQYLEDIECQVLFVTSIDFEKEKIDNLEISFGLTQQNVQQVTLNKDKPVAEQLLIMPLTDFFDQRQIEYSVMAEKTNGDIVHGNWKTVSLADEGNIINITTSIIQTS
ncbi:MAG: hypothetical protein WA874_12095 [Chryseosolibacter sp.]